jgi:transglutaminase-like putative cysteine protease
VTTSVALSPAGSGVRFQTLHKLATYAVAATGLASLAFSGELGGTIPLALAGAGAISWFAEGEILGRRAWRLAWNAATLFFFGLAVVRGVTAGTLLTPAVELSAFLQLNRLFNRRTARDYVFVNVLAFSHLVAATVLDSDLSYAGCFAAFVVFAPWAMVLSHLRREIERNYLVSDPAEAARSASEVARILRSRRIVAPGFLAGVAALSVPTFLFTAAVFVLFPRLGFGLLVSSPRYGAPVVGFSDRIELGDVGTLVDDPSVVLRLEPRPATDRPPRFWPVYLRGTAFDRYDGRVWHRTPQAPSRVYGEPESGWRPGRVSSAEYRLGPDFRDPRDREPRIRVWMDPLEPPVVFVTPDTLSISVPPRLEAGVPRYRRLSRGAEDEVRHVDADDLGLEYTLNLDRAPGRRRVRALEDVARYLEVPRLAPRVVALADHWVGGATEPLEKARRIGERLRRDYQYSRELGGDPADPLEDFLLRRRRGHCEYFSTALAILLRVEGVPTRNVSGFFGGEWNAYGRYYAVRQSNAHSWVEAWIPGRGWTTMDPTPPGPEGETTDDAWDALRDVGDALRQRWQRWVVSYDLGRQIAIFQSTRRWLSGESTRTRGVGPGARRVWLPPWTWLVGAIGIAATLFAALRRRRGPAGPAAARGPVRAEVALYTALERALLRRGRGRPPSRTPREHALILAREAAPEAPLATEVTEAYLAARYAGEALDAGRARSLRAAVRKL